MSKNRLNLKTKLFKNIFQEVNSCKKLDNALQRRRK